MKSKEFRALVARLGGLTAVQRNALVAALSSKGSANDVIGLIETAFAKAPICGHCGSEAFCRWGVATSMKRYMCRACDRIFNALTGTPLAHLRKRELWLDYARALVDGVNLRKAASRVGVHLETSFRWRHRFLAAAKNDKASAVTGIVEADETFILKSAKGSKKPVGRAPRKRGGKAKKKGLSTDEHDAILIVRDRHGATTDQMRPDLQAKTFAAYLAPVVAKDAVLVSDGRDAYGAFAHAENILHVPIITSRGEHVYEGFHIQKRQRLHEPVQGLAAPVQRRRQQISAELSWLAPRHRARRRRLYTRALPSGCVRMPLNMKSEQSRSNRPRVFVIVMIANTNGHFYVRSHAGHGRSG